MLAAPALPVGTERPVGTHPPAGLREEKVWFADLVPDAGTVAAALVRTSTLDSSRTPGRGAPVSRLIQPRPMSANSSTHGSVSSDGVGISFADPGEQFGVNLSGVLQDDFVVPPVGRHTFGSVNPCRFEFPGQDNIDQNPATAGMDPKKCSSVGHMERRCVLLQLTPVQCRNLAHKRTVNAGRNRVTINAFSCRASHPASIRQTDAPFLRWCRK